MTDSISEMKIESDTSSTDVRPRTRFVFEIGDNLTHVLATLIIYSPYILICTAAVIWAIVGMNLIK